MVQTSAVYSIQQSIGIPRNREPTITISRMLLSLMAILWNYEGKGRSHGH